MLPGQFLRDEDQDRPEVISRRLETTTRGQQHWGQTDGVISLPDDVSSIQVQLGDVTADVTGPPDDVRV